MGKAGSVSVATAFIVLGLLTAAMPAWSANGVNWIIAGVVSLLAGWASMRGQK